MEIRKLRNMIWTLGGAAGLLLILAGCSNQGDQSSGASPAANQPVEAAKMASASGGGAGGGLAGGPPPRGDSPTAEPSTEASSTVARPSAAVTAPAPDRYLIRNATLLIEVKDARIANDKLIFAVTAAKGYVSNLQETVDALGSRSITMKVRVPATLFDSSMQQLSSLGKVMNKNVNAEDVTEEFVDTESTLRNFRKTEERLLAHLNKTGRLADTLRVENELTRVRSEIEQREGRLRFLGHRVEFSTIDVTLQEAAKTQPALPPETYSTGYHASEATRSLMGFLLGVWTMVIWLGIWAVVWAPLVFLAWIGVKWYRRQQRSRMPPPFFPPDEPVGPPSERVGTRS